MSDVSAFASGFKDSVAKPIDLYNVHSPASRKRPLTATVRQRVLQWFLRNVGEASIIGGDSNPNKNSLDDVLRADSEIQYHYEDGHMHGDLVSMKVLQVESMPCEVTSTSKAHKMVVVMVTLQATVVLTPRWDAQGKRIADLPPLPLNAGEAESNRSGDKAPGALDDVQAEAKRSADKPATGADANQGADEAESNRNADKPGTGAGADEADSKGNADKPATYPLADALFRAIGEQLDAGEAERELFSELAEQL